MYALLRDTDKFSAGVSFKGICRCQYQRCSESLNGKPTLCFFSSVASLPMLKLVGDVTNLSVGDSLALYLSATTDVSAAERLCWRLSGGPTLRSQSAWFSMPCPLRDANVFSKGESPSTCLSATTCVTATDERSYLPDDLRALYSFEA